MTRVHLVLVAVAAAAFSGCGGEQSTDQVGSGGAGGVGGGSNSDPKACPRVCNKLLIGQCGYGSTSECGQECVPAWQYCAGWPALVACIDAQPQYSCVGPQKPPCHAEMSAVLACAADAGPTQVDCVPGSPLPACSCDGGQSAGGICPPNGKTTPCCG
ncbi:MAG: hypothetical protein IT375_01295 [Polyangiaceae bacterium]|nr:hypothetical protein [Polyangiaceae bacterium]